MRIIVDTHKIKIIKNPINEKEINISKCEFEFAEPITDEFVKEAFFTLNGKTYKQEIINNECSIPYEVLEEKGEVEIGVVAYLLNDDEYEKRYNPEPDYIDTLYGSLKDEYENSEEVTPTDKEQMEQALQDGLNAINEAIDSASNLDIDANKVGNTTTITITKQDSSTKEVEIIDGVNGITPTIGANGNWFLGDVDTGKPSRGVQGVQGEQGIQGETGATGQDGSDGFSPIATVSPLRGGAVISITDSSGTTTASIRDGSNGQDGQDGVSPTVSTSKSGDTTTIEITDKDGKHTATIYDGTNGSDGADGSDGVSLQYNWSGTSLGIKREDEQNYDYVNLKGDTGANGSDGNDGADATINGVNTLTIEAGSNITIDQEGSTMTINATGGGSGGDVTVIYAGKISQYNTSAKALNITNYSANTRLILKHNDSSSSMYIKFNNSTKSISIPKRDTSGNNTVIANNLYYLDINSISSTACNLALTWCQTYEYGAVVSIFKGITYGSGSWTVSDNQYNLLVQPTIHIDISNGTSNVPYDVYWSLWRNTTVSTPTSSSSTIVLSKTIASQKPLVHLIGSNYDCVLKFDGYTTTGDTRMYYSGTYLTQTGDIYKVTLTGGNPNVVSLSVTSTKLGTVFNSTSISGYDATATQTLKNVNGTLTWVND